MPESLAQIVTHPIDYFTRPNDVLLLIGEKFRQAKFILLP